MKKIFFCLVLTLSLSPAVRADKPQDDDIDLELAKKHYYSGLDLYDKGQYATALSEFQQAYTIKHLPNLQYNIAKCLDHMEHLDDAVIAYKGYLEDVAKPGSKVKPEEIKAVEERIKVLQKRITDGQTFKPEPEPFRPSALPQPVSDSRVVWRKYAPVIGLAAGALAIGLTGLGLYLSVGPDLDDLHARRNACGACDLTADIDSLKSRENAGYALLAIGGAAAVTSVVLAILTSRHILPEEKQAWLAPSAGGLVLSGHF